MLYGQVHIFHDRVDTAEEALLFPQHILIQRDNGKILAPCNSRHDTLGDLLARGDDRARILRTVGVSDVDRNVRGAAREDRILMQHGSAHVGQLAQLLIRNTLDRLRILDDPRICHQESGDIRPVLVNVGAYCARDQRARDVRSAAGERDDLSRFPSRSVKARDHSVLMSGKLLRQGFLRVVEEQSALLVEQDQACCVDKIIAQKSRRQLCRQIFPAACDVVCGAALLHLIHDLIEAALQIDVNVQIHLHREVPVCHDLEHLLIGQILIHMGLAQIQQIRHLVIGLKTLARRRNDHVSAFRVCQNDLLRLGELDAVRDGRSAKFQYFRSHLLAPVF